ncbi:hypothetical protein FHS01_002159 [Longimicrobium terrae]|uniref:Uncharacterized protein n=1 Tax=Longimicrobium terrae TaxID=1639882 RepID=A0A841GXR7_9BACT|nr:hypothetical protein [Longimicrobium terrae]MBB6070536.1 hypothetical protein [Longimicrobium terrae]
MPYDNCAYLGTGSPGDPHEYFVWMCWNNDNQGYALVYIPTGRY